MPRGYQAPVGKFNNRQKDVARMLREKFDRMKKTYKVPEAPHDQHSQPKPNPPQA